MSLIAIFKLSISVLLIFHWSFFAFQAVEELVASITEESVEVESRRKLVETDEAAASEGI